MLNTFAFGNLRGKKVFKNRESFLKSMIGKVFGKAHTQGQERARRVSQIAKGYLTQANGLAL